MQHNTYYYLLAILPLFLISGCEDKNVSSADIKSWLLACPLIAKQKPVLSQVGDVTVTVSEFQDWLMDQPVSRSKTLNPMEARRQLENFLNNKVTADLIRKYLTQRAETRRKLASLEYQSLISLYTNELPPTETEMRAYYNTHVNEFTRPTVLLSHILVKSLPQARKVQALLNTHRSIPGLHSDALTNMQGNYMNPTIVYVLESMKPGEVAEPIQTLDGFEVVRREMAPPSTLPYESVKGQLRVDVAQMKLMDLYQQQKPRSVNEDLLDSIDLSSATPVASAH